MKNKKLDALDSMENNFTNTETAKKLDSLKWYTVDKKYLKYNGFDFYGDNTEIQVKPVSVELIRIFTSMDENNISTIRNAISYALENHVRIKKGSKIYNGTYAFSHDQTRLLLLIRDYSNIDNKIEVSTKIDGKDYDVSVEADNLYFNDINEKFKKYYDETTSSFKIEHKKCGLIEYKLLTIHNLEKILKYIRNNTKSFENIYKSFVTLCPLLKGDNIEEKFVNFKDLTKDEFSVYNFIANQLPIDATEYIQEEIEGELRKIPFGKEFNIQNIFCTKVSIDDFV